MSMARLIGDLEADLGSTIHASLQGNCSKCSSELLMSADAWRHVVPIRGNGDNEH